MDDAKLRAPMDKRADSVFMNFPKSVTWVQVTKVTYDSPIITEGNTLDSTNCRLSEIAAVFPRIEGCCSNLCMVW